MRRYLILGLVLLGACSNEEPEWRTATAENTIEAMEGFLVAHPDGNFADSAKDQLEGLQLEAAVAENTIDGFLDFLAQYSRGERAKAAEDALDVLYDARARAAPQLTEVSYLQDATMLRILRDADGEEIVRRFRGSEAWLLVEKATGDTLYATGIDADGTPSTVRVLCLDESGAISQNETGEPVLLPPFSYHTFTEKGAITGRSEYDPFGRPNIEYRYLNGCLDCASRTEVSDCVFVW